MDIKIGLITSLCTLIIFLFVKLSKQQERLKQCEQNEKIIQLLQAYPVHQYSMPHMLERSLAMVFSMPELNLLPKGAIFLLQDDNRATFSLGF